MTLRRTKIIVTIGPASESPAMIEKLILAGAEVFRCNFSHDSPDEHKKRIDTIRSMAKRHGQEVAIIADLQGPKIRISRFKHKKVTLTVDAEFVLDAELGVNDGDEKKVGLDYKTLPNEVNLDDYLLLDDGRVVLQVKEVLGSKIICRVIIGGELSNNKGLNKKGGGLSADALTNKDKSDLKAAASMDVDYFAISFVRNAEDVKYARKLARAAKSEAGIIAKIERAEAVEPKTLDAIIIESDAIMVARGDLGVEIGDDQVPALQKLMINRARALNKPAITATQMMESMIHNSIPTRAEVSDVANAVIDRTDAVMLSAETATGDHPDLVVKTMARICLGAESQEITKESTHRIECRFEEFDEAIAMATMFTANHVNIKAVITLTESGKTPLLMSRIRTGIPIFSLTRNKLTERKSNLYCNIYPIAFDPTKFKPTDVDRAAIDMLKNKGALNDGDFAIFTHGDVMGKKGQTNTMRIIKVGEHV